MQHGQQNIQLKSQVVWDVSSCKLVNSNRRFGGACCVLNVNKYLQFDRTELAIILNYLATLLRKSHIFAFCCSSHFLELAELRVVVVVVVVNWPFKMSDTKHAACCLAF